MIIVSPANGTETHPGQKLSVSVAAGADMTDIALVGQDPLGFFPPLTGTSPYKFSVKIPSRISPGSYALTAVGNGTGGADVKSEPVIIWVERADKPLAIEVQPSSLEMEVGDESVLVVYGTYTGDPMVDLSKSRYTSFVSQSLAIARVSSAGVVTATGVGVTNIVVDGNNLIRVTVRAASRPERSTNHSPQKHHDKEQ